MVSDVNEARHLDLVRIEHAAGTSFGCDHEDDRPAIRSAMAPAAFAVATFATVAAATLGYLI